MLTRSVYLARVLAMIDLVEEPAFLSQLLQNSREGGPIELAHANLDASISFDGPLSGAKLTE